MQLYHDIYLDIKILVRDKDDWKYLYNKQNVKIVAWSMYQMSSHTWRLITDAETK